MFRQTKTCLFAIAICAAAALAGCGDDPSSTGSTSTSSSSSGSGGGGGSGGGSGGGGGGTGGGAMVDPGHSGHALVNSGSRVKSSKYMMDFTLGQSSPAQQPIKSSKYQLNGGLIGATGSK